MPLSVKQYDIDLSNSRWDRLVFEIEHWILSLGRSDIAKLRGYLRVKAWRDDRSGSARLRAIFAAAKLPVRALRDAWRAVGAHGDHVAEEFGVPRARQLIDLWWVRMRHAVKAETYYDFRLYRPGHLRRAPSFFQDDEDDRLFRLLSIRTARKEAELLLDKARFEEWLTERGFPAVRTLMEFSDGKVVRSCLPSGRLPPCDLFTKPNDGAAGDGVLGWSFDGEGWIGADGGRRSEQEMIEELADQSREDSWLRAVRWRYSGLVLQERLCPHAALLPLAPRALSSIRVMTLRRSDGQVEVVLAVCKLPTGAALTDHISRGAVGAPVDLATGRLGPAIIKSRDKPIVACERHPDTGVAIEGFQLPHWEVVKRLAVSAHEALGPLLCIGWDIAILDSGPVIIEGNDNPSHRNAEPVTGMAYGETAIVPELLAQLQASFVNSPAVKAHTAMS